MSERIIEVCCSHSIEQWRSRELAMDFYLQGALECEGSESERYLNIYSQLKYGSYECCDEDESTFNLCKVARRYMKFPNGTSIRDLFGRVEYPV